MAALERGERPAARFAAALGDLRNWRTGVLLHDWLPLYGVLRVYSPLRGNHRPGNVRLPSGVRRVHRQVCALDDGCAPELAANCLLAQPSDASGA